VDPEDGRAQLLHLTAKGRNLAEMAEADLDAYRRSIFAKISLADLEASLRVFDAMEKNAPHVNLKLSGL
jgi:MarR family transcriptional regulator, transcriptional regulator for hemolysin